MKKIISILLILVLAFPVITLSKNSNTEKVPFSTNKEYLTIWNGREYVPIFIKGINLGVSVPGTFPGELAATRSDYSRWLAEIKDVGFNCIRLYTLHYPRFYEVLDSFNLANPQHPIYIMQGVWLEEELTGYDNDLYFLNDSFRKEIEDNIDCVHGNKSIPPRLGKADGNFDADVSKWCLGYIIGREIHPGEVLTTNEKHASTNSFTGNHFSIDSASPSEVWVTEMLDHTVDYENSNYNTSRPVSIASWPTLDPIKHPEEENREEDTVSIDLSKVKILSAPAGLFVTYHAYPYYPDFISLQSSYQSYADDLGPNSYLGYLTDLKAHYKKYPVIIAEYGVPSNWMIAHYASSGMNQGGFDEYNQGLTDLRILDNIRNTGCGGGIQFEWIDEWFKRTWIADPLDYIADSRILWQNVASAEQNYGLLSYGKTIHTDTLIKYNPNEKITYLKATVNYSYLELEMGLKNPLDLPDKMWVTFDTYSDSLGESILPTGDTIPSRSEFALYLTNYSAELMVTQAYDVFGIWHHVSSPEQLYHSIPTDGAPWDIVRVKNNAFYSDVQYIGDMQVNYGFQPYSSKDGVIILDNKISIRIPWFYLNFVSPDQMKVFNDNRATTKEEDTISDGIKFSVLYKEKWYSHNNRFVWQPWVRITDTSVIEHKKVSYYVMKDNLFKFNTPAIARLDSFNFQGPTTTRFVSADSGVLRNDFDLDGDKMVSLITQRPVNGQISLENDGAFEYMPNPGFTGYDSIQYSVYDGYALSVPATAVIYIEKNNATNNNFTRTDKLLLSPNPAITNVHISYTSKISRIQIFSTNGILIEQINNNYKDKYNLDVSHYAKGIYIVVAKTNNKVLSGRFIKN